MHIDGLVIFGAGGHAKVVLDALDCAQARGSRLIIADGDPSKIGTRIADLTVSACPDITAMSNVAVHVAIGDCNVRDRTQRRFVASGACAISVFHPRAAIAGYAEIGAGSFVAAQAVIGPGSMLGEGVIVNHGAVVDHDCIVGSFSHIAPNSTLGGGVRVGANVLVGAGATILPGVKVGDGAVISAGATVVRDVAPGEKVIFALTRKS